ncbi:MAG: FAD-dependent oxidoreductase, partial [Propionibacteriaceae bacterium]|nr:FAD-dependent oxidoreductase [Propionibacteriaceae bacterium]
MNGPIRTIEVGCPVIIGAGLAGLTAAVELSPTPCLVLSSGIIGDNSSTAWAQGGIASAVGSDDDPELHAQDTLTAGAGLCEPEVVRAITSEGPSAIEWLAGIGARFDRHRDGTLALGLEGAHSRNRIVHAMGDETGAELLRAVALKARRLPSVNLWERCRAVDVYTDDSA